MARRCQHLTIFHSTPIARSCCVFSFCFLAVASVYCWLVCPVLDFFSHLWWFGQWCCRTEAESHLANQTPLLQFGPVKLPEFKIVQIITMLAVTYFSCYMHPSYLVPESNLTQVVRSQCHWYLMHLHAQLIGAVARGFYCISLALTFCHRWVQCTTGTPKATTFHTVASIVKPITSAWLECDFLGSIQFWCEYTKSWYYLEDSYGFCFIYSFLLSWICLTSTFSHSFLFSLSTRHWRAL